MELNEYQKQAMTTCTESSNNFSYMMLNLVGEVGEFASKVAKMIRKEELAITDNELISDCRFPELCRQEDEMQKEAGDIFVAVGRFVQRNGVGAGRHRSRKSRKTRQPEGARCNCRRRR